MAKLSKAVAAMMIAILLMTQAGCLTQALLKLGEPTGGARDQPAEYSRAIRYGRVLGLEYESSLNADGNVFKHGTDRVRVDLAGAEWLPLWGAPIDPYCTPGMWFRLAPDAPPQPPAPLLSRPATRAEVAALHKQRATGFPPMSVQLQGLDAWVVCGAGDHIGITQVPAPLPPQSGERSTGAVVAIVLLFPFVLAVDIAAGVFYVIFLIAGGR